MVTRNGIHTTKSGLHESMGRVIHHPTPLTIPSAPYRTNFNVRVAFATTEYGAYGQERGGLGYYLERAVPLLAADGHDCEVFLASGAAGETPGVVWDHEGFRIQRLGDEPTPFDRIRLPRQVRHHLRSAWIIAGALADAHARTPFEVLQVPNYGISGLFVDIPVPAVMRFSSHAPTWHSAAGVPRRRRVIFGEMLQHLAIRRAELHYAPSHFVADLIQRETGHGVDVIPPPAPPRPDRSGWDRQWVMQVASERPYVVHAGQLGRAKGTDLVAAAAMEFMEHCEGLHIHFCGRDAGAANSIELLQREYPDRLHYHGQISPNRLHPLMDGSVAIIAPPRADNLPNVVIEAMMFGTPVIGVRGASIDELVVDGESGFLVPSEDSCALADAVVRLVQLEQSHRQALGINARDTIEALLNANDTIAALAALYQEAAEARIGTRAPRRLTAASILLRLTAADLRIRLRHAISTSGRRVREWSHTSGVPGGR